MIRVSSCALALGLLLACGSDPEPGRSTDTGVNPSAGTGGTGGSAGTAGTGPGMIDVGPGSGGQGEPEPMAVCGNAELEPGELCDDGGALDGDGCSADCLEQDPTFDCSAVGQPCTNQVVCGNAIIEGSEVCDDGGTDDGDGCSADCGTVEDGWGCARPGKPCVVLPVCGNGERERGEQCDDGQSPPAGEDGCSATCQLEEGFWCPTPGEQCSALVCGDGVRTPDEGCDDDELPPQDGDGCSSLCEVEAGFRCSSSGCAPICGDGVLVGDEQCDDENRASGDGCSAACLEEPFYSCDDAEPSACTSTIECGNSQVDPGEICDPPGNDGCNEGCKSFSPDVGSGSVCGNSIIEAGEECDPNGPGCTGCAVEDGWSCPRPGVCFEEPYCGDGLLHAARGEECDDGDDDAMDGCTSCAVDDGWSCYGLQPSLCVQEICGNGVRTPSEECDDGDEGSDDGCSSGCLVEVGWACPIQGEDCIERCGDGATVGEEECDDGDSDSGDGCNAGCRVEPGYVCPEEDMACIPSECGNDDTEPGEGCDDGNQIAGDGCGPTCQKEPTITPGSSPSVTVYCGDGIITGSEACDDGNDTPGDGCAADCQTVEEGFGCDEILDLPESVEMQVTYRDFKAGVSTVVGGHPDFQYGWRSHVPGISGAVCTSSNTGTCGRLDNTAGKKGKPVLAAGNVRDNTAILNSDTFGLWYQSSNSSNVSGSNGVIQIAPFTRTLTLTQTAPGSEAYRFESLQFFPLEGETTDFGPIGAEAGLCDGGVKTIAAQPPNACDPNCGTDDCRLKNYNFTTELRYFFQYQGGETLTFYGDDDVWVYINGRLAVDLGGLHQQRFGRVLLGDDGKVSATLTVAEDSNCSINGVDDLGVHNDNPTPDAIPALAGCYTAGEDGDDNDDRFALQRGNVYEIVLFHAERQSAASNFQLTLSGFLAPRSYCEPECGDGIVVAGEVCDDGDENNEDGVSGVCNTDCTVFAYCGDGDIQEGEACDNGANLDLYLTDDLEDPCAPGCVLPPSCGDDIVQAAYEQCDNGNTNGVDTYGPDGCTEACMLGGFCGDGEINDSEETCDLGADNGVGHGPSSCGYDCKPGPKCGDNVRNGSEECDGSANCNIDCTLDPFCGDGVASPPNETCDYGQFASDEYGSCTDACLWGPNCGDGSADVPYEECDLGLANSDDYDGCSEDCIFGPRCGDGVLQAAEDEVCDNGFNDDGYALSDDACGPGCSAVPYCGDGVLDPVYELCDEGSANSDTAYDGCADDCDWGPYCGDGIVAAQETCDDGLDNTAYASSGEGCGYDCDTAPYCGDGVRNGPEQCDLGEDNTGEYGGCNANCSLAPYCGDGEIQRSNGEECDDGPTGSLECSVECEDRTMVK
jgi:cysteine-rich repeat protein